MDLCNKAEKIEEKIANILAQTSDTGAVTTSVGYVTSAVVNATNFSDNPDDGHALKVNPNQKGLRCYLQQNKDGEMVSYNISPRIATSALDENAYPVHVAIGSFRHPNGNIEILQVTGASMEAAEEKMQKMMAKSFRCKF